MMIEDRTTLVDRQECLSHQLFRKPVAPTGTPSCLCPPVSIIIARPYIATFRSRRDSMFIATLVTPKGRARPWPGSSRSSQDFAHFINMSLFNFEYFTLPCESLAMNMAK